MQLAIAYTMFFIIPLVVNAKKPEIICTHFKKRCLPDIPRSGILTEVSSLDLLTCSLLCQGNLNCCSFFYNVSISACALHGDVLTHQKIRHEESDPTCPESHKAIHIKPEPSKCVKDDLVSSGDNRVLTNTKDKCDDCGTTGDPCVLYKKEHFTSDKMDRVIELPLMMKPGMKLTVCGRYKKDASSTALSVPKDPKHSGIFSPWLHIESHWDTMEITIIEGMTRETYTGEFPILNPSNFTLAFELTPSSTKMYADKVLVKSRELLLGIKELNVHRYSKVYHLVVQKTGDGCGEVGSG